MHPAKTNVVLLLFTTVILPMAGCRICADCEDMAYPAYGGARQRTQRESGRVGSIFDPGGGRASDLVSRDEPDSPDEIQRELQKDKPNIGDPDDDPMDEGLDDESETPKTDRLRDRKLEDIENDAEDNLRGKSLDDIEVRIIPGRKPKMVTTR